MSIEREFLKKLRYATHLENDLRKELEELLAQPEQWKPECCICKTNKNVEWVGGFQAYRCNSKECFSY